MSNYTPNLSIIAFTVCLIACGPVTTHQVGGTDTLAGLEAMASARGGNSSHLPSVGKIREMALKEVALSLGAQSGLAWRAKLIDNEITKQARNLDAIYDFNALLLEHNVLPPVLLEGQNTLNMANAQTIRISDRSYKVAKQAHFVTTSPNWRQYIWMDFKNPEYPNATLLPKTKAEREIWMRFVRQGWDNGIEQANTIFEESIARLKEDFSGMILYRKLLAMNMVSPPYVSNTDLGVTGDADEIHIDDRVLRITALPGLNVHSKEWRAAVAEDEQALEQFTRMENNVKTATIKLNSRTWQPLITPIN